MSKSLGSLFLELKRKDKKMYDTLNKKFVSPEDGMICRIVKFELGKGIHSEKIFINYDNMIDSFVIIDGIAHETLYCEECGEEYIVTDTLKKSCTDSEGTFICPECLRNKYYICNECGKYARYDKARDFDGDFYCDDCFDEKFVTCDQCGSVFERDSDYAVHTGDYWFCDDECAHNYGFYECEYCGEWFTEDEVVYTQEDNRYCMNCIDRHNLAYECNECGEWTENPFWGENGDCFCENCYEDQTKIINKYGYKPNPIFLGNPIGKEFFGAEIEVCGNENYAEEFLEYFSGEINKDKDVYLKHDGSVVGFEIVTHPMSRSYIYNSFKPELEKGMNFLKDNGFSAHNKAGIHIHVSNVAIDQHMYRRLVMLLYPSSRKIRNIWLKITQRKEDKMNDWSSMDLTKSTKKELVRLSKGYEREGEICKPNTDNRYTAINPTGRTIEFRIFNSNLRIERIMKNYEVIFSLLDFAKGNQMPTIQNYLRFVFENREDYTYLADFLIEKEIFVPKEAREKTEIFLEENNLTQKDLSEMISVLNYNQENRSVVDENEQEGVEA